METMIDEIKECHHFIGVPADGKIFIYKVEDVPSGFFKIGNLFRIGEYVYKVKSVGVRKCYGSCLLEVKILPFVCK